MGERILIIGDGFIGNRSVQSLVALSERLIGVGRYPLASAHSNFETSVVEGREAEGYLPLLRHSRVEVHVAPVSAPARGARVINACSGSSIGLNDLFGTIEEATGRPLQRSYDAGRKVDMPLAEMQADRARELYGRMPDVPLQESLGRTRQWFSTTQR